MNYNFWENIKIATTRLGIPDTTFRTWKNRNAVPKTKHTAIYFALQGSSHEVSLFDLDPSLKKHNPTPDKSSHPAITDKFLHTQPAQLQENK